MQVHSQGHGLGFQPPSSLLWMYLGRPQGPSEQSNVGVMVILQEERGGSGRKAEEKERSSPLFLRHVKRIPLHRLPGTAFSPQWDGAAQAGGAERGARSRKEGKEQQEGRTLPWVFWFDSIVVREPHLCDFRYFKFVEVCFVAHYLGMHPVDTCVECVFCCGWVECSTMLIQSKWMMVLPSPSIC